VTTIAVASHRVRAVAGRSIAYSARVLAVIVGVLAFLPIANWIPGGHQASWYARVSDGFVSGTTIAIGVGIIFAILSGKFDFLWRPAALDPVIGYWRRHPLVAPALIAAAALFAYVAVAQTIFSGRPLNVDEVVQVFQAQIFAGGSLSQPAFRYPEFFSSIHVVDMQGRVYSQFPAGGPAMLAIGVMLGVPWLVGPVFGAVAVFAFAAYVRTTEQRPGNALAATVIFAFAPFALFMSGSHMNHVTTLAWLMIAVAAMAYAISSDTPRPWTALLSGFGFGMAATIRPVDAIAFALPAGGWYLLRAIREPARWRDALPAAVGVVLPIAALMWVNSRTTGAPLLFGYEVLWGQSHQLGFHAAPWGMSHTPSRGLELLNLYFLRLQTYFLETPVPSLVPAIVALAASRKLRAFDRYLLSAGVLLAGLYFAYWFDGFYLGPRFMYPLLPLLAIWTARFFPSMRHRLGTGFGYRAVVYGSLCAMAIALVIDAPIRAQQYRNGLATMRWNADSAAAVTGVRNAIVLVRESWGAQIVARLWALGISRSKTELLYWNVDACKLEEAITHLEANAVRGQPAYHALSPLLSDSARLVGSPVSPDTTERYLPGSHYSSRCLSRIADDRAGFTLFAPRLLDHGGGNLYARDLHGRDSLLVAAYPDRPLYLLKPATSDIADPPRFYRLFRDSLERAWRAPAR
jgi:hypothetical protein